MTFTPRSIVENPFLVRDRVRDIAKQPFFDAYITPIALAFIYQGLELTLTPNALGYVHTVTAFKF